MKIAISALMTVKLSVFSAVGAIASPSEAFNDFQDRCIMLTAQDQFAFSDLQKHSEATTQKFIQSFEAQKNTVLWKSTSEAFVVQTYDDTSDYCMVFGFNVDFPEFQTAYNNWKSEYGVEFLASRDLIPGKENKRTAVFLVRDLGNAEFQQVTVAYEPRQFDGFATMVVIRLDQMSKAAKELFDKSNGD